jgi:hypothetical protein
VPTFSGHWQAGVALPLVPQVKPLSPQWVEARHSLQPLDASVVQVRMSVPEQEVELTAAQPVPAVVPIAGQTQAPATQELEPPHPVVDAMVRQAGELLSGAQVATVLPSAQNVPAAPQASSQVQPAVGSVPLQLVSVGQVAGAEVEKQPWAS